MSALDLAIPYGLVGVGGALLSLLRTERSATDALLLFLVWPIYAPFVLARRAGPAAADPGRRADHPLAAVLPDPATLAAVERRLGVARHRVADIAELLARPELCEPELRERLARLEGTAASPALEASLRTRLASIERLRAVEIRFRREIEEVTEALIELDTQAELVRLAGAEDPSMADVLRELGARSESLRLMLAEEIPWTQSEPEGPLFP